MVAEKACRGMEPFVLPVCSYSGCIHRLTLMLVSLVQLIAFAFQQAIPVQLLSMATSEQLHMVPIHDQFSLMHSI